MTETKSTNFAPYASVALATLGGMVIGGIPGGIIGFSTGVMDEYLISNKMSEKHELSTTAYYSSAVFQPWVTILSKAFPAYALPIQEVSFALSAAASHFTSDFLDFKEKIDVPLDSFFTMNKIFDEKEIFSTKEVAKIYHQFLKSPVDALKLIKEDAVEIYNNEFLYNFIASNALSLTSVGLSNLFLYTLGSYGNGIFISTLLAMHKNELTIKPMLYTAGKVISLLAAQLTLNMYINSIQNGLSNENSKMVIDKVANILLDDGNSRKVLGLDKEEGQQIINSLFWDLFGLLNGANKLNTVIIESAESVIALNNIIRFSPDILLPYIMLSLIPKQQILSSLLPESKRIANERADVRMKANILINDIIERAEQIDLQDGREFMKYKFNAQWGKIKALDLNATYINKLKTSMDNGIDISNRIIDVAYFGSKHASKSLDVNKIPLIIGSVYKIANFLSSNLNSQSDNIEISLAKQRVDKLFELINAVNHHADRLVYEGSNIIFNNYSLSLGEQEIVQIDELVFDKCKHYAITGKSGCGKSSTLMDLKSGVVGALNSAGEIHLPRDAKTMLLDQQLFIPKDSSLLETIYFPMVLKNLAADEVNDLKAFVISLFKELEIDQFVNDSASIEGLIANLDTQKFKLSGGQIQKIAIIQAILNKPNIIIMDENFARLDNNSVIQIQQVITKYLSDATILVVDHKAHSHNYNNFYDMEVHFGDGKVVVSEIADTPTEALEEVSSDEEILAETWGLIESFGEAPDMDKLKELYGKLSEVFGGQSLSGELAFEGE